MHRRFQIGAELLQFRRFALGLACLEFRHDLLGKQLEGFTYVRVLVHARLLDKGDLIDTTGLEFLEMFAQIVRGTNAPSTATQRLCCITKDLVEFGSMDILELLPQIGAPRSVFTEPVQATQSKAEKFESFEAARNGGFTVFVAREARYHADIRVDGVANGHTFFALDDAVVLIHPRLRLGRIDECKGQCADAHARRHANGLPLRTSHPQGRMRPLHRFRNHVATRHLEVLALISGVRVHRQHVAYLLGRFQVDLALLCNRYPKTAKLELGRGLARTELHATSRDQIQGGDHLCRPGRVVVTGNHLANTVAETNVLGALGASGEEHFRRG